uniref:AAA_8 domain-containing protein n=1 Tax=Rhodnius prolixus TaxID=13249 RepID=T1I3Q9_RHOPR
MLKDLYPDLCLPPEPILTRWGTWLEAAQNEDWNQAIECVAILDILMGLAKYSLSIEAIFGTVTWNSETAKIDRRLLSLFSIFYTEPINKDRIEHIFNVMLKHHTSQFDQDVRNLVPELVQITSKILKFLLQYNSTYEPLQLTLKVEVMENLSKIHRVLQISGGNMILVSPRSYGKWTLTKLAAFIAGYLTVIDSLLATCSAPWIYTDRELNYIQNFFQSPNT